MPATNGSGLLSKIPKRIIKKAPIKHSASLKQTSPFAVTALICNGSRRTLYALMDENSTVATKANRCGQKDTWQKLWSCREGFPSKQVHGHKKDMENCW